MELNLSTTLWAMYRTETLLFSKLYSPGLSDYFSSAKYFKLVELNSRTAIYNKHGKKEVVHVLEFFKLVLRLGTCEEISACK